MVDRRREAGRVADAADQVADAFGGGVDGRGGPPADVLEEAVDDLAVLALGPAADDPAVAPDRGSGVAHVVEARQPVVTEIPLPLLPTHGGGVERGQQRHPRLGLADADGVEIVGEHEADAAVVELDLGWLDVGQGLLGVAEAPTRPPFEIGDGARTEGTQPAARKLGSGLPHVHLGDRCTQPRLGCRPPVLGADPRTARPTPDDVALGSEEH